MRKENMFLGIVWTIVALALLVFMLGKMTGRNRFRPFIRIGNGINYSINNSNGRNGTNGGDADYGKLYKQENFDGQNIDKLDVSVSSESVTVKTADGNDVIIELYGNGWSEKYEPKMSVVNNNLVVKTPSIHGVSINGNRKIVISVPEICMKKANFKVEHNTASGSFRINDICADVLEVNTASGSVHVNGCKFEKISVNAASGSIHVSDSDIKQAKTDSASGSIHLSGNVEQFKIDSASGSVHVDSNAELKKDSRIETVSGSVNLKLPSSSRFNVKYDTLSGSFKNEFDSSAGNGKHGNYSYDGAAANLSVETVSGSIRILKN